MADSQTPLALSERSESKRHDSSALRYLFVYVVLLGLTALTYGASRVDLGHWNLPIALLIASTKAGLVLVFFMHLLQHSPSNRLVLASALVFLLLLMVFVLMDLDTRFPLAVPPNPWFSEKPLPP